MRNKRSLWAFVVPLTVSGVAVAAVYLPQRPAPVVGAVLPRVSSSPPATRAAAVAAERPTSKPGAQLLHADLCYFNALSLRVVRDAYLASLSGAEPSARRIPEFFPLAGRQARASDRELAAGVGVRLFPAEVTAPASQLGFVSRLASCELSRVGSDTDLPLAAFDRFVKPLARWIVEAERYYGREEYHRDRLRRGLSLHRALVPAFAELDAQLARLGALVFSSTYPEAFAAAAERDALERARTLAVALLTAEVPREVDVSGRLSAAPKPELASEWKAFADLTRQAAAKRERLTPREYLPIAEAMTDLLFAVGKPDGLDGAAR